MENYEGRTASAGDGLGPNSPNGPYWDSHNHFSFPPFSWDYPWEQWQYGQEQERTSPSVQFEVGILPGGMASFMRTCE